MDSTIGGSERLDNNKVGLHYIIYLVRIFEHVAIITIRVNKTLTVMQLRGSHIQCIIKTESAVG